MSIGPCEHGVTLTPGKICGWCLDKTVNGLRAQLAEAKRLLDFFGHRMDCVCWRPGGRVMDEERQETVTVNCNCGLSEHMRKIEEMERGRG